MSGERLVAHAAATKVLHLCEYSVMCTHSSHSRSPRQACQGMLSSHADTSQALHQASLLRNKLLSRAVSVINGLQHDTDNLVAATELEHGSPLYLKSASACKNIETGKSSALASTNTPVIKIPARFRKSSVTSTVNTDHDYQRTMHDAAERRNLLLKRAYGVICNLQVCFYPPLC